MGNGFGRNNEEETKYISDLLFELYTFEKKKRKKTKGF